MKKCFDMTELLLVTLENSEMLNNYNILNFFSIFNDTQKVMIHQKKYSHYKPKKKKKSKMM